MTRPLLGASSFFVVVAAAGFAVDELDVGAAAAPPSG
jgi:hypothetical protein